MAAVACGGVFLEPVEACRVELGGVPVGLGEPAVEAGRVAAVHELAVDRGDVLASGHQQAGQVFGEVDALRFFGEPVADLFQGFLDDGGHGFGRA